MTQVAGAETIRHFQTATDRLLAATIDQSADCATIIALDGGIEYLNRASRSLLGVGDLGHVVGKQWSSLWPAEAREKAEDSLRRARAGETVRFEARSPIPSDASRCWDVAVSPILDPNGEVRGLVANARDITDLVVAREVAQAMSAEMAHRLRNAYAVTSALLTASARGDPERESFARRISEQFMHLGAAQTLMLSTGTGTVSLQALVPELTRGFASESCRIDIGELPDVPLDDRRLQPLALTIGELCTNSAKYGAIGHGGQVAISARRGGRQLSIQWSETSSRPVENHERDGGTGFDLIRRVLTAQKGGFDVDWRADGLEAAVTIRLD